MKACGVKETEIRKECRKWEGELRRLPQVVGCCYKGLKEEPFVHNYVVVNEGHDDERDSVFTIISSQQWAVEERDRKRKLQEHQKVGEDGM